MRALTLCVAISCLTIQAQADALQQAHDAKSTHQAVQPDELPARSAATQQEPMVALNNSIPRTLPTVPGPEMPRVYAPTRPRQVYTRHPWRHGITATVFWIGETPTANNPTPNNKSSWDSQWQHNFGGYDDPNPEKRRGFVPAKVPNPGQNPFYIALPYNDVIDWRRHKPEAPEIIPWFNDRFERPGQTVLKGQWLALRVGGKVCYAQWEDCGPFNTDDPDYVFGDALPNNRANKNAGIDISPAVRDFLGIQSHQKVDWRFVDIDEVPDGPWRTWGSNNPFVNPDGWASVGHGSGNQNGLSPQVTISSQDALQQEYIERLDELRRMRDQWYQENGMANRHRRY